MSADRISTIVSLGVDDAEELCVMEVTTFPAAPWSRVTWLHELSDERATYVALRVDDELVGCAGVRVDEDQAHLMTIGVVPGYQRSGYGAELLEWAVAFATAQRCTSITLETGEKNMVAIALYERFGFEVVGSRPNYYPNQEAALIMSKPNLGV